MVSHDDKTATNASVAAADRLVRGQSHPSNDNLSWGLSALDSCVSLADGLSADWRKPITNGADNFVGLNQPRDLVQQLVLLDHVGGLMDRPAEHVFPVRR